MLKTYIGYFNSPIGLIEVKTTDKYVVSISFVDEAKPVTERNELLEIAINQLSQYFNGDLKVFNLPIILEGTTFQNQVWNSLLDIPYGETKSYKDVAKMIDNERAVRAVGNANNKNEIVIVIPCHRVIGSNGHLIGYGGGLDKKEWLINFERGYNQ